MQTKEYTMNGGARVQRVLIAALLLAALGTGTLSALPVQNQAAPGDDETDRAFATSVVAMTDEISSILRQWSETAKQGSSAPDFIALRSVGLNLSNRSRDWYSTLDAMPVTVRFAESKRFLLLGLKEFEGSGDATVRGMDLYLGGNETASVPLIIEAGNYAERGTGYFRTANELFPRRGDTAITPVATVTQPAGTLGPARPWGKRYVVGNPGSYLGARAGSSTAPPGAGSRRIAAANGTGQRPGSRSYSTAPPAAGSFVRWYPAARWRAGIR